MAAESLRPFDFKEECVSIYIQYDFLPARQLAAFLNSIDGVAESIKAVLGDGTPSPNPWKYGSLNALSVESIHTGNSIEYKLKFKKEVSLPSLSFDAKMQVLSVLLPDWTKYVFLTGCILAAGAITTERLFEIQHVYLENQKLQLEIEKLKLEKLTDNSNPDVNALNASLSQFNQQINQFNIQSVTINGVKVKTSSEVHVEKSPSGFSED